MDNQVYGVSTDKRLIESLRHNCGPLLLGALEDTGIIETMLNPDGTLWVEKYGAGQECIGSLPLSQEKPPRSSLWRNTGRLAQLQPKASGSSPTP